MILIDRSGEVLDDMQHRATGLIWTLGACCQDTASVHEVNIRLTPSSSTKSTMLHRHVSFL